MKNLLVKFLLTGSLHLLLPVSSTICILVLQLQPFLPAYSPCLPSHSLHLCRSILSLPSVHEWWVRHESDKGTERYGRQGEGGEGSRKLCLFPVVSCPSFSPSFVHSSSHLMNEGTRDRKRPRTEWDEMRDKGSTYGWSRFFSRDPKDRWREVDMKRLHPRKQDWWWSSRCKENHEPFIGG